MEKRVIAFDIGNRRIGVSISDPFNSFAIPLETYFRGQSPKEDAKALARLAEEEDAGIIVCGLPLFADGARSEQTELTEKFIALLKSETSLPVVEADERYTTGLARGDLALMGVSAKKDKQKKRVDSLAASYILENYLSERKKEEHAMSLKEDANDYEEDENLIELVDEDGNKSTYEHLLTFEYKKEWYVALTPASGAEEEGEEEEDGEGEEIAIYHLVGGEDDEQLEAIEDEELLDELFDEFCELYEDQEDPDEE